MGTGERFFFTKKCDRCGKEPMTIRTMSWFTEEIICMNCSAKETVIKTELRKKGIKDAKEGCGYIPKYENSQR